MTRPLSFPFFCPMDLSSRVLLLINFLLSNADHHFVLSVHSLLFHVHAEQLKCPTCVYSMMHGRDEDILT
jgi:hypothetical protein